MRVCFAAVFPWVRFFFLAHKLPFILNNRVNPDQLAISKSRLLYMKRG
ncbi:hypothetical protein HMPREF9278_0985 [Mobiluncus mulieris FB024-16]|nr:hypothetical protein HMPREF9278_0985 [Mobiluncus mulieris FB024-16]